MRLLRACNDFGISTAEAIEFEGKKVVPLDFLKKYLSSVPEGTRVKDWVYFTLVEVIGVLNGKRVVYRFTRSHPPVDERGFNELFPKIIGYPLSIGAQLLAQGKARKKGIDGAEAMLPAQKFMNRWRECDIGEISEEIIELG